MATTLFYYSGTGNSLSVARKVAQELGETQLISIPTFMNSTCTQEIKTDTVGIIFPVYIWGIPAPILRFIRRVHLKNTAYVFAICTNGGQVSNTLVQLKKILSRHTIPLACGFEITMPSNYIPWGGPGPREKQVQLFNAAQKKISHIVSVIKNKFTVPVEKGPLWQRILFTALYRVSFSLVPSMDKKFWVDEKCNHCSLCVKLCPSSNITMNSLTIQWNHRCEQCFCCLQWCPTQAIQYGKRTPLYERYHHPDVHMKDFIQKE